MLFNGIPSFGLEKQKSELLVRELSASKKERLLLIPPGYRKAGTITGHKPGHENIISSQKVWQTLRL